MWADFTPAGHPSPACRLDGQAHDAGHIAKKVGAGSGAPGRHQHIWIASSIGDCSRLLRNIMRPRKAELITDEKFAELVQQSSTIKEVALALGYASARTAKGKVAKRIELLGLCTLHFRNWLQYGAVPTESLLVKNSAVNNQTIKKRVLEDGFLKNVCVECGNQGVHNGKPLILHLDHIDGDNSNNELLNLRMLCPNCHSQTETFSGRNKRISGKNQLLLSANS